MYTIRQALSWGVLTVFVVFFFLDGLNFRPSSFLQVVNPEGVDFSQFITLRTLTDQHFPIHVRNRTIIVGDIHGMHNAFQSLLDKLSFNPQSDVLIHCGDFITRGTLSGSLAVLEYMSSNNVTGVRGNHDQKVIEWRSWLNWVRRHPDGKEWLEEVHREWDKAERDGVDADDWIRREKKAHKSKWWRKVPEDWKMLGEHYKIARKITDEDYQYLLSLPLTLFVPSTHTYIVHAGILPSDPRLSPSDPRQPLAHVPALPSSSHGEENAIWDKSALLRRLQGLAIMTEVPQNTDPWVVLNMRGVLKDNSVTRSKHGTPWSELWQADMSRCAGFETRSLPSQNMGSNGPLPCLPSMIVYGHAASRGLDIKRWSVGLDSGCVYGRKLTALVIGSHEHRIQDSEEDLSKSTIPYGDNAAASLVSVKCHSG